ncbi:MAG: hypothetical protein RL021_1392 [Bacteroidota bacterium]|jgi:predicted cupin superfamily sugar epimerase
MNAEYLINTFSMNRHPEGGYYKETYRSPENIPHSGLPGRFTGDRSFSTAIYFLLIGEEFSSFHRIKADEVWHFYTGSPLELSMISPEGVLTTAIIGNQPENGHHFQYTVPAGYWFASRCCDGNGFSFVGCTVAPGFDFADFELAKREALTLAFPDHSSLIRSLCRN